MGQFTLSTWASHIMARILVASMLVAMAHAGHHVAAPVAVGAPLHYGHAIAHHAPAIVGTQVHEHVVPGPTYHTTHQEVVGHRTVQVGSQPVQVGHTYTLEQSVHQAAPYTYQAGPPKTSQSTVPIAPPAIPAAPAPYAAIPPAPTNQGPAPADTVTVQKISAPVRTHTVITPQVKRIEPELQVNKYEVEVPVAVPVPSKGRSLLKNVLPNPTPLKFPTPSPWPNPTRCTPSNKSSRPP